ncbi:hypothetical protein AB0395_08240 [Streptosporangium sp. NPDC051023]|uniref:hypothetical protein n=1 Tax=Streptosporangium sp. NPDC051023 TaxID=3155410 RepID=UPI003450EE07
MRATIEARRDLGPEYESALIESFVERLDATIAARVRAEMQGAGYRPQHLNQPPPPPRKNGNGALPLALGSMALAIPLTAIATESGTVGVLLAWGGIVAVNFAHAIGRLFGRD